MSAAVYYKSKCLAHCTSSFLSDLSDKMICLALKKGHSINEYLLGYISFLNHSSVFDLDGNLSDDEIKLFAKFGIEAIDKLFEEGYFVLSPAGIEYRMQRNIPLDMPMKDHFPALEYKENLKELLKELDNL